VDPVDQLPRPRLHAGRPRHRSGPHHPVPLGVGLLPRWNGGSGFTCQLATSRSEWMKLTSRSLAYGPTFIARQTAWVGPSTRAGVWWTSKPAQPRPQTHSQTGSKASGLGEQFDYNLRLRQHLGRRRRLVLDRARDHRIPCVAGFRKALRPFDKIGFLISRGRGWSFGRNQDQRCGCNRQFTGRGATAQHPEGQGRRVLLPSSVPHQTC